MRIYAKLNGLYLGVDPNDPNKRVYANRAVGGPWEAIEATDMGDGLFELRFTAANVTLSVLPNGVPDSRPAGTFGAWEQIRLTNQPEGASFLYRDGVSQHFVIEAA